MRHRLLVFVLYAAIGTAASGLVLSAQSAGARPAIEATNVKFSAAMKAGNAADMAALYAEDAVAFPPNSDAVRGRAAIQKLWQDFINSGAKEIVLTTTEVEEAGNMAHETGTAVIKDGAGKVLDKANYIVIYKQVGGKWMLYRDIWNSSMPAPAAEKQGAS